MLHTCINKFDFVVEESEQWLQAHGKIYDRSITSHAIMHYPKLPTFLIKSDSSIIY